MAATSIMNNSGMGDIPLRDAAGLCLERLVKTNWLPVGVVNSVEALSATQAVVLIDGEGVTGRHLATADDTWRVV